MDVEKFIELVKSYPILYDKEKKGTTNFSKRVKIWEIIATEMNESSEVLRSKWKGLKDGYTKYKKQTNDSSLPKTHTNWCWADHLHFLDNYGKRKSSTSTNFTGASFNESSSEAQLPTSAPSPVELTTCDPKTSPLSNEIYFLESTEEGQNDNVSDIMPSTPIRTKAIDSLRLSEPLQSSTSKRKYNPSSTCEDEEMHLVPNKRAKSNGAIDLLFKSYAETFKTFSVRKQASLKVQLAKLFADAEIEEIREPGPSIKFVSSAFSLASDEGEHE